MNLRPLAFLFLILGGHALAQRDTSPVEKHTELAGYDSQGGAGKKLYEITIDGTIELGLAAFVERAVSQATKDDVFLLKIKTFGGRVDAAVRIRDALLGSPATTVAYVDQRAISAGALITLACDTVIMSRGSTIGAATPVQGGGTDGEMKPTTEKVVSYMRAEMRATAEAKGRRADIAEAMVDADIEIEGVIAKGKLLTLTSDKARELKIADALADHASDVVTMLNIGKATKVEVSTHWGEKLARLLTEPTISSMLMTFGFLGLLMELYSPGFGVGGMIGVVFLALFFLGQYAANLAGWEEFILFIVGFGLLMLEVFVVPGFGVTGIAGILAMGAALVLSMFELEIPWDVSFELGYLQESLSRAAMRLAVAGVALVAGMFIFAKFFPNSFAGHWLVFRATDSKTGTLGAEAPGSSLPEAHDALVGQKGVAHSVLRPAGVALFGDRRIDVLTEGEFIDKGATVVVVEAHGSRVVVRKADA